MTVHLQQIVENGHLEALCYAMSQICNKLGGHVIFVFLEWEIILYYSVLYLAKKF